MIGSANSSNTRALEKLARESGCARVYRVNGAGELPDDLAGTVGVTAGASAPEERGGRRDRPPGPRDGVEEVRITEEDEYFPPPRELRDLLAGRRRARHLRPRRLGPRPPVAQRPPAWRPATSSAALAG